MPSQKCLDNVASSPPPGNVWCGNDVCASIQASIDHHCNVNGYRPDDPWLMPTGTPPNITWCSCCCSCYGYDTPIETRPGVFRKVQEIKSGDTVLTAGPGLQWRPTRVRFASGMQTAQPAYPVLNVVYRYNKGEVRILQVTDDTLFLMDSGLLKAAGVLVPGDQLRRADGRKARVIGPVTKSLTVGVHSIELGPFDGSDLEGHLLNSYGVVTADFSVQRSHSSGGLRDDRLIDKAVLQIDALVAGTEEYLNRYRPTKAFLDEVEKAGLRLDASAFEPPQGLVTIPAHAKAFFTPEQADSIRDEAPKLSSTNTFRITVAEKVFELARPSCSDVVMLIDWNNSRPGVYAWEQLRQNFVVITGGLLRVKSLTEAGIALLLAHALAYQGGAECVGEADHEAVNRLRRMWPHSLFPTMSEQGIAEVRTLFEHVGGHAAMANDDDRCRQPSLQCRMRAFFAALQMMDVPDCAVPDRKKPDKPDKRDTDDASDGNEG